MPVRSVNVLALSVFRGAGGEVPSLYISENKKCSGIDLCSSALSTQEKQLTVCWVVLSKVKSNLNSVQ